MGCERGECWRLGWAVQLIREVGALEKGGKALRLRALVYLCGCGAARGVHKHTVRETVSRKICATNNARDVCFM